MTETVKKEGFHNFKNEWKYNIEMKMNASGELYIGSLKIRSDDDFGIVAMTYKLLRDLIAMGKEDGFRMAKGLGTRGVTTTTSDSERKY